MTQKSKHGFQLRLQDLPGIRCKPIQNRTLRRSVSLLCSDIGGQQLRFLMRLPSFDGLKRLHLRPSMAQTCRLDRRRIPQSAMVHYGSATR